MARTLGPTTTLSEQAALNHIAFGVAAARSTDVFAHDAKGASLALSVTNASKAVPSGVRVIAMWCATAFRWRMNTVADLTDGAYASANDVVVMSIDPDDSSVAVATVQAILASGSDTLYFNWIFGS